MARTEARIFATIWTDSDFLAMSGAAQRAYMFLISQSDLSHAGVLPLRVRRWAQTASDSTPQTLGEALRELERHRFIVADRDTEEVLVRTLIRHDRIYLQPNLLRAARKSLPTIASQALRSALAVELAKVLPDTTERAKAEVEAMLELLARTTGDPSPNPSAEPTEFPSSNPLGDRGVVTDVSTGFPYPLAPDPSPKPPLASLARPAEPDFADFWTIYPRREAKAAAKKAWDKAIRRADPGRIIAGAERYRDDSSRDAKFTAHASSWLNADRWDDEPLPRGSPNGQREYRGALLNEGTIANLEREQRIANGSLHSAFAIEGPSP